MNKILTDIKKKPKEEQIKLLEESIRYHNNKYFLENNPEISDPEFDELTEYLRKLKPDSPVLFELIGEMGNIEHKKPMLSIEKKYTHKDIIKWINNINDKEYIVEPKYDGMAASYQNGILATRGNGKVGEDLSQKFKYLNVIGKIEDYKTPVYGEIIIPNSYFNKYLSKTYKNPRNAVVGIMKAKRPTKEAIEALNNKKVHFVIHDQAKKLKVTKDELINEESWENILETMFRSDYPLDGIVIKATSEKIKKSLKPTEHHEKWQVAYKVPAERKWSTVIKIKNQVGRTGRVTSVAVIKPINISGATVTNVTLHNASFVEESKIDIGSKVEVCRSGEVIPFITQIKNQKGKHKRIYKLPTHCPICNTKLKKDEKYITCTNKLCPARTTLSIEYFFKTLNVLDLGIKTIERFINELHVKKITDFYKIKESDITNLDGFGEKSAKNIVHVIQETLNGNITETQLLQALGIKDVGPVTSKWILDKYGFWKLPKLKEEELANINGIGNKKAKYFIKEIKEKWLIVEELKKLGLKFKKKPLQNKLQNKSFCITGKKETKTRDELITLIEENGGLYKSSITKDLDYLIAGDKAGSKLEKAKKLGVKIITEAEFLKMININ